MNEKDFELDRIVSVVINCTKSSIWSDNSITKEELLGKSKNENACMARAILVSQLVKAGFTISTISGLLRRTAQCTPIPRPMKNVDELISKMEAMRYSDYCIALQIVYWWLI